VILGLGLSPQITRFDLAIVSESIGSSLMVALVASTLHLMTAETVTNRLLVSFQCCSQPSR